MIPILYRKDEIAFSSNGIGRLTEAISCIVTEERNGVYELEMTYPNTGEYFNELKIGRYIYATHDGTRDGQPFMIYKISKPINGVCTYSAQHISYKLSKITVRPFTADGVVSAMAALKANSMVYNDFQFHTTKNTQVAYEVSVPSSVRSLLGGSENSFLDRFGGGEYKFDKFDVWLYQNRGEDRGVEIRYGRNMADFSMDTEAQDTYTAIAPYWEDSNGEEEPVYLPEGYLTMANVPTFASNLVTDDLADVLTDDSQTLDLDYYDIEIVPLDLSDEFDEKPTVDELRERAMQELTGMSYNPTENITFTSVETDNIQLCDTVHVYFSKMGVSASMKVIKLTWNTLADRIDSIECGAPKTSFSDVITAQINDQIKTSEAVSNIDTYASSFMQILSQGMGLFITKESKEQGGYQYYMHNRPNRSDSQYQWTINSNGFAVSQDYGATWTAGIDSEGNAVFNMLSANVINAMEIHGSYVDGGEITFAPDSKAPITAKEVIYSDDWGGVLFEGKGEFSVDSGTVTIAAQGSSRNRDEIYIYGKDSSGYLRNILNMVDSALELNHFDDNEDMTAYLRLNNNGFGVTVYRNDGDAVAPVCELVLNKKTGIRLETYDSDLNSKVRITMHPSNGLGIYINDSGYNSLGFVSDGNGHMVLGK